MLFYREISHQKITDRMCEIKTKQGKVLLNGMVILPRRQSVKYILFLKKHLQYYT